jgi:hypothetical protein
LTRCTKTRRKAWVTVAPAGKGVRSKRTNPA